VCSLGDNQVVGWRRRQQIRALTRRDSTLFSYGVRLAVGVGATVALVACRDVPEGLWTPLAVLLVLRPGPGQTYVRYAGRVLGLVAGVVLGTGISMAWPVSLWLSALVGVAFLTCAWLASDWLRTAALSAAACVALDVLHSVNAGTLGDRTVAAAIGAAIAIWLFALIPDPLSAKLSYRVGELLQAELSYAAAQVSSYVHPPGSDDDDRNRARSRALAACTAFAGYAAQVPTAALGDARALTVAVASLDAQLPQSRGRMDTSVISAADNYVAALRTCVTRRSSAGQPVWHLDIARLSAAELALRSVAGIDPVLATYAGLITQHALRFSTLLGASGVGEVR
jgi:uncharacterized membrane protein YccC